MKKLEMILATIAALAVMALATPDPAEARGYRHYYARGCGYTLYYDYSHSNFLSPLTYIYPAANWGPFFACQIHYGPIYVQ
jgi:hypothetical protein